MDAERRRSHIAFIVALKVDAAHKAKAAAAAAAAAEAEAKPRREEYERWDRKAAVRKMNKMTPRKFRLRYRVSRATFDMILDAIEDDLEPASRAKPGGCIGGPILAQLKLGATLRYLAGSNNIDCSDSHAMASFFKHLYPVVEAISKHFDHAMHFPQTAEELADAERVMSDTWGHNMRGAIAALDGLVVRVRKPWMSTAPSAFSTGRATSR
ncbi:hypothetical protein T492DRAFT_408451 [Pavlovales sp. CCMP2436]|nr:hypothetical protein T492DRAFT_408451 [Pavlovales sp. CCMP2436]